MSNPNRSTDSLRRAAPLIGLGVALLPVIQIAWYLGGYLVNLPWWDEYDVSVHLAEKAVTGTLTLRDMFTQQNGHIIFFTNLITVASTWFQGWYVPVGSWISFGLAILNLAILLDLFRRDSPKVFPVAAPVIAALVFSVRQIFNWQLAFQSQWFFVITWFLIALWLIATRPIGWRTLIAAALVASLGIISFSLGVMLWFVLPVALWLVGYRDWRQYVVWGVIGALVIGAYFLARDPSELPVTYDPILLARYTLIMLGSPLIWGNPLIATLLAVPALILFAANGVYLWRRMPQARLAVWMTLAAFAFATAGSTAVGRAFFLNGIDPIQPMEGRYVSVSVLLWVALIALMLMSFLTFNQPGVGGRWKALLSRANMAFMGIALGAHLIVNIYFYQYPELAPPLVQQWQADCLRENPQTFDDTCLRGLHFDVEKARKGVEILEKYHLALFSDQP